MRHVPVLLNEVIESLQLKPNVNVIDCTLGDAGHAEEILKRTAPNGILLGIDADPESILRAKNYLYEYQKQVIFVRDNFVGLKDIVEKNEFGPVHAVLLDLGWSSSQFEERRRGFSFLKTDEPLDMRYHAEIPRTKLEIPNKLQNQNFNDTLTAAEIVNRSSQQELTRILKEYGEEVLALEIACAIVGRRKEKKIATVGNLVEIILAEYRKKLRTKKEVPWVGGLHPATKVFQALRIAVNDELGVLEHFLPQIAEVLAPGGRAAIITFHSLEDRIVKHYFKEQNGKTLRIVTKKPIAPTGEEIERNPRAGSAKLRVMERLL